MIPFFGNENERTLVLTDRSELLGDPSYRGYWVVKELQRLLGGESTLYLRAGEGDISPPDFGKSINPIPTWGGGYELFPTHAQLVFQIFRRLFLSTALSVPNMSLSTYKLDGRSSFREKRTYFDLGCHNITGVRRRFMGVKGIEYTHVLD